MGYSAGEGVSGGQLAVTEIFEVSPVVLIEALEPVVHVNGCSESV